MPENPENDPTFGQPASELSDVAEVEAARPPTDPAPPLLVEVANPTPPGDDVSDNFQCDQVFLDGVNGNADDAPQRLVERQADRIRTTLVNTSTTATVSILSRGEGTAATAFPLPPGASVTIKTRAAVYGRVAAATTALVAVLSEFRRAKASD